jgi:DNA-binding PadR family transcriptional regulator
MYELLILGALMAHERSGYKLGLILEASLEPRRKISNGVLYPMLHKLAAAGYITLRDETSTGRRSKVASITDTGRKRVHELMREAIPEDAKRESAYRFKFRSMNAEPIAVQRQILTEYQAICQVDKTVYSYVATHIEERRAAGKRGDEADSILSMLQLQLALANTKLQWVATQLAQLPTAEDQTQTNLTD